jgi:hypothetical protein
MTNRRKAKQREAFWRRVEWCEHTAGNHFAHVNCGHQELGCAGGSEWRCIHCKAFITEDPCGHTAGISGWSWARYRAQRQQRFWR